MHLKYIASFSFAPLLAISSISLGGQIATYTGDTSTPQIAQAPQQSRPFNIHLNSGYSWNNWQDSYSQYQFNSNGSNTSTLGLDASYTFNKYYSASAGFLSMPSIDYTHNGGHTISQWLTDIMGEIHYQTYNNLNLYIGAGLGIRFTTFDGHTSQTIRPAALLGADYTINDYWDIQLQFLRVNAVSNDSNNNYLPTSNNLIFGLGYSF